VASYTRHTLIPTQQTQCVKNQGTHARTFKVSVLQHGHSVMPMDSSESSVSLMSAPSSIVVCGGFLFLLKIVLLKIAENH
jgi:hypothetical protein